MAWTADTAFFVEVGTATVKADSYQTGNPVAPFTAKVSESTSSVAVGANVRLGNMPLRFSLFKVQTVEDSVQFPDPAVPFSAPFTFHTDLDTSGIAISLNPSWQLNDAWSADAGLGALYLRQKVEATSPYGNFRRSDSSVTAIGNAGISYRFTQSLSARFGVELAQDYASAAVGVKFDF